MGACVGRCVCGAVRWWGRGGGAELRRDLLWKHPSLRCSLSKPARRVMP